MKCPAADRLVPSDLAQSTDEAGSKKGSKGRSRKGDPKTSTSTSTSRLEIYTLNEARNAVVGEILLGGGAVTGTVILAGSRKVMEGVVRGFEKKREREEEEGEGEDVAGVMKQGGDVDDRHDDDSVDKGDEEVDEEGDHDSSNDDDDDEEEEEDDEDSSKNQLVQQFEKNSFRSPKFWIRWQGQVPVPNSGTSTDTIGAEDEPNRGGGQPQPHTQTVTDAGYIVFSGNQCDRFQGTISCELLGWKNVKMSGWKVKSQSARDYGVNWVTT